MIIFGPLPFAFQCVRYSTTLLRYHVVLLCNITKYQFSISKIIIRHERCCPHKLLRE